VIGVPTLLDATTTFRTSSRFVMSPSERITTDSRLRSM